MSRLTERRRVGYVGVPSLLGIVNLGLIFVTLLIESTIRVRYVKVEGLTAPCKEKHLPCEYLSGRYEDGIG